MNFICKYCKQDIEIEKIQQKGGHVKNCNMNPNRIGSKTKKEIAYELNPKKCLNCAEIILYKKKKNNYCSSSCSAQVSNKNRKQKDRTHDFKEKMKKIVSERHIKNGTKLKHDNKCKVCKENSGKRIYCSKKCRDNCFELKGKISEIMKRRFELFPELHPNRLCAGKVSYPENMLNDYFKQLGFIENKDYIRQYKVGKYYVDFVFLDLKIAFEVDGERWHDLESEKEKDRAKEISNHFELYRFWSKPLVKKEYHEEIKEILKQKTVGG